MQGKIVKGIAGFYYVHVSESGIYECKAKGIFRKDNKKPLVGDDVLLDVLSEAGMLGNIREILPRKNELIRPAVANVDQALVIFSIICPLPNLNLLDRFLVMMGKQNIPCIICFNKQDIDKDSKGIEYEQTYADCGYQTLIVSARKTQGLEELKNRLYGKTTTVAGPSGVGKSSIINCLQSDVVMETGDISRKIDRGKHTTRHSELIAVRPDTYIFDTPGFSSLALFAMEKEELAGYYPEFIPFEKDCRFGGCAHLNEPDCGVKKALAQGRVSQIRYDNYRVLYDELSTKKKYDIRKDHKGERTR